MLATVTTDRSETSEEPQQLPPQLLPPQKVLKMICQLNLPFTAEQTEALRGRYLVRGSEPGRFDSRGHILDPNTKPPSMKIAALSQGHPMSAEEEIKTTGRLSQAFSGRGQDPGPEPHPGQHALSTTLLQHLRLRLPLPVCDILREQRDPPPPPEPIPLALGPLQGAPWHLEAPAGVISLAPQSLGG